MRDISAKRAVELSWDKVRSIVAEEIKEILGLQVQCKVNVVEGSFWDVTFISYRLPLPKPVSSCRLHRLSKRIGRTLCLMRAV